MQRLRDWMAGNKDWNADSNEDEDGSGETIDCDHFQLDLGMLCLSPRAQLHTWRSRPQRNTCTPGGWIVVSCGSQTKWCICKWADKPVKVLLIPLARLARCDLCLIWKGNNKLKLARTCWVFLLWPNRKNCQLKYKSKDLGNELKQLLNSEEATTD